MRKNAVAINNTVLAIELKKTLYSFRSASLTSLTLDLSKNLSTMSAAKPRKEQSLSKVLVEGFPDAGTFENIPRVRKVSQETTEPYVGHSIKAAREDL
jgi:hypothetical protein